MGVGYTSAKTDFNVNAAVMGLMQEVLKRDSETLPIKKGVDSMLVRKS